MNIALRTRIKVFFRPAELKSTLLESLKDLKWSIRNIDGKPLLIVNNPSPFHMSFIRIELNANGQTVKLKETPMALPMASQTYELDGFKPTQGLQVIFSAINDFGSFTNPMTLPVALDL